jgi:hypothetical protein
MGVVSLWATDSESDELHRSGTCRRFGLRNARAWAWKRRDHYKDAVRKTKGMWTRIQTVVEGIAPRSTLTGPSTCHCTEVPLQALLQMIIQDFHWRGCYVELTGLGSAWLWVRRGRGCRPSRMPDGMGTTNRDSSRKGTSAQCAGEVPTQEAGTAGTEAEAATATIAVVSEAADAHGTDTAAVG